MTDPQTCPKCGAGLPPDAPAGVCPKCLMLAGVAADTGHGATASRAPFEPPDPETLARHFPDLEILEPLGHGGMGAVYKARQKKLDRLVALKIIREELADDPDFAARFHREARTLARLNHPNIVAVHDFGEVAVTDSETDEPASRTLYYFLMEYVDGTTLREVIHAGELRPEQALAIVPAICEALQFAHDEGVVHRDIKPENVLLDRRGRVKIADFGLARLAHHAPHDFTLTAANQVMGTPRYMAPEQMEGSHAVDHRADIYSLGVVFYEMLTGQTPAGNFDPPSKKVHVDVRLDEVVLRAMAREPQRRYQKVSQVKTEVETIAGAKATSRTGTDFVEIESDLNGPALAMMLVGPLIALAHSIAVLVGCLNRFDPEPIVFGLPGVIIGMGMFVGGWNMRRLRSRGWAQMGVVAGVIPASPGWPITVALSIWANNVLNKPQVRRAFIERARERHERATAPQPVASQKPEKGLTGAIVWTAIHFVLWASLFAAFLWRVPQFQDMFEDFAVDLPVMTIRMIQVSYAIARYWYLLIPLGVVAMAFDFTILWLFGKLGRTYQSIAGGLLTVLPLLLGGLLFLSLWLPLTKMIESLS